MGQSHDEIDRMLPVMRRVVDAVRTQPDKASAEQAARAVFASLPPDHGVPAPAIEGIVAQYSGSWFRYFLNLDSSLALREVACPILALNGERDLQVNPAHLARIRGAAVTSHHVTVKELPGLNHLFQSSKTGAIGEYAELQETFSPVALDVIGNWLAALPGHGVRAKAHARSSTH